MIVEKAKTMTEEQVRYAEAELFRIWKRHRDGLMDRSQWPCILYEQETGESRHSEEAAAFSAFIAGIEVGLKCSVLNQNKEREARECSET